MLSLVAANRGDRAIEHSRRRALILGSAGFVAASTLGQRAIAAAPSEDIARFTEGAQVTQGGVGIEIDPYIADGHSVPITVQADGAEAIALFALLNPTPELAIFTFSRFTPTREISTKIRLAATQDVIAIARMEDGSFRRASTYVTVAVGGCNI